MDIESITQSEEQQQLQKKAGRDRDNKEFVGESVAVDSRAPFRHGQIRVRQGNSPQLKTGM